MDDTSYKARLCNAKKEVIKAESKISSYTSDDILEVDKTEYIGKLTDTSRKVGAATEILDEFIFDVEEVGFDTAEIAELKIHLI